MVSPVFCGVLLKNSFQNAQRFMLHKLLLLGTK